MLTILSATISDIEINLRTGKIHFGSISASEVKLEPTEEVIEEVIEEVRKH